MRKYIVLLCITLIMSQQGIFAQNLKITEVFVDGTDEWLEITNTGPSDFVGPLSIDGVKTSTLSIASRTIPSLQSLIIGDNLSMITNPASLTTLTNQGLSMTDTNAINITLSSNSTQLDSFSITQGQVQSYDNTKTSFMSLYSIGGQSRSPIPSLGSYNSNNSGGFTINPGIAYTDQGALSSPLTPSATGSSSTGTSITIDCHTVQSGWIEVSELHRGTIYTPYIEIISKQNRQGSLVLSGDGLTQAILIPSRTREQNTRYLITATTSGLLHNDNVITIPGWGIQQTGIVSLIKDNTTNIGYILIDGSGHTLSSSTSYQCLEAFDTPTSASPGFAEEFLAYANIQTVTQTVMTGCTTGTGTTGGSQNTGSQTNNYNWVVAGTVKISKIDYDPPGSDTNNEVIGYTLTGSTGLDLSGRVLTYDGKTKLLGSIALLPGQESLITGNYTLVNSRPVCVSLQYESHIIDTACYDPNDNPSPFIPGQGSGQISTGGNIGTTGLDDDMLSQTVFEIVGLVYDPPGDDSYSETVSIRMLAGSGVINLNNRRLRVGTRNKTIQGSIGSGQTLTLVGNFQMSNSNATCVALVYDERVYDEYCYNPISLTNNTNNNNITTSNDLLYNQRIIHLLSGSLQYDPAGSDEGNESFTLLMTGGQQPVDLTKLSIRINGGTKKKLFGMLYDSTALTLTGTWGLPNSRTTCVDLMEGNHIFDTACYDPLSGATELDKIDTLSTGSISTDEKESIRLYSQLSKLRLAWILPNPLGKDIAGSEQLGFRRGGENITIQSNKYIKVVVGKSAINLSGLLLDGDIVSFSSPKALSNQASCVSLLIYQTQDKTWKEQDKFCYPQSKEGVIYYHPEYKNKTPSLSTETIKALSHDDINLSNLSLRKEAKNICLVYNKQTIRCMAGGGSSQSVQNKTKLANAYIRLASDLLNNGDIATLRLLTHDYQTLNKALSDKKSFLTIQGYTVSTTDLERYHTLVAMISPDDKARESLVRDLWGEKVISDRYRLLRNT